LELVFVSHGLIHLGFIIWLGTTCCPSCQNVDLVIDSIGFIRFIRLEILVFFVAAIRSGFLLGRLNFVALGVFNKTLLRVGKLKRSPPYISGLGKILICSTSANHMMMRLNWLRFFTPEWIIIELQEHNLLFIIFISLILNYHGLVCLRFLICRARSCRIQRCRASPRKSLIYFKDIIHLKFFLPYVFGYMYCYCC